LGILEVVEADVSGAAGRHHQAVRTHRLTVGEVEHDLQVGVCVGGVEHAGGLVALEGPALSCALSRDVAVGDGPVTAPDGVAISRCLAVHQSLLVTASYWAPRRAQPATAD